MSEGQLALLLEECDRKYAALRKENEGLEARLKEAEYVAQEYELDENLGDTTERFDTILWIVSGERKGTDWGHPRRTALSDQEEE